MKRVLVTNDDGINAPGLKAIALALAEAGFEVTVCAPDKNWSACGHVKTLTRPMRIEPADFGKGLDAFACDGAPSDCVALGLMGALERDFDFVVSGMNPNNNIGIDATYSGTLTAAMEAGLAGLPGYAVSIERPHAADESDTLAKIAQAAVKVIQQLLPIPTDRNHGKIWSINLPALPEGGYRGARFTSSGLRVYNDRVEKRTDPFGKPYYWICGEEPTGQVAPGNEVDALKQGYISVCPIRMDMTDHEALAGLKDHLLTL